MDERLPFPGQREIKVAITVTSVFLKEGCSGQCRFQPFLSFLNVVEEVTEHPYLSSLEPDELVRVIYLSVTVKACEIASPFTIRRVLHPEWNDVIQQRIPVPLSY